MRYLAECLPDTLLVKTLTKRKVMHIGGKARLIKKMLKSEKRCITDTRRIRPTQVPENLKAEYLDRRGEPG